jgi:hypothetical protein
MPGEKPLSVLEQALYVINSHKATIKTLQKSHDELLKAVKHFCERIAEADDTMTFSHNSRLFINRTVDCFQSLITNAEKIKEDLK